MRIEIHEGGSQVGEFGIGHTLDAPICNLYALNDEDMCVLSS